MPRLEDAVNPPFLTDNEWELGPWKKGERLTFCRSVACGGSGLPPPWPSSSSPQPAVLLPFLFFSIRSPNFRNPSKGEVFSPSRSFHFLSVESSSGSLRKTEESRWRRRTRWWWPTRTRWGGGRGPWDVRGSASGWCPPWVTSTRATSTWWKRPGSTPTWSSSQFTSTQVAPPSSSLLSMHFKKCSTVGFVYPVPRFEICFWTFWC